MATSETVTFKGQDVVVSELTVAQLDAVMSASEGAPSIIDRCFNREMVTEEMLVQATGVSSLDLRSVAPSELRPLVESVKRVNVDFLSGMASLVGG